MRTLQEDIDYALVRRYADVFSFLYSRTNEDLELLFNNVDVMNKRVFSVLSSSDYLFSAIDAGASVVDTFDINPLTYRYYHLRKWLLQLGYIDAEHLSVRDVLEKLDEVLSIDFTESERVSFLFWKYYLSKNADDRKLLYSDSLFLDISDSKVRYADNLKNIATRLSLMDVGFKTEDICMRTSGTKDERYDTVFLSNILDHNRIGTSRLKIAQSNVSRMLSSGGRVVLSHFNFFPEIDTERRIFSKDFFYDELGYRDNVLYYQYVKK